MCRLLDAHDALLFDLDGTLFHGGTPVAGALDVVTRAVGAGHRVGYLTNNGSRSPRRVAAHLTSLGFPAVEDDIVTSGQAAARLLAERLPAAAKVLVVGTDDLRQEVLAVRLAAAHRADEADAVVQGHSPETGWPLLAEACLAIRGGALWVACNVDATLPTERGELPGNGSMVAALRTATGAEPLVAGKPEPWVFTEAVRRLGADRALVVGDRLDTDIAGANAAGLPALAVLTGVSGPRELLAADVPDRPRYIGADLSAIEEDTAVAEVVVRAPWTVSASGSGLVLATDRTVSSNGGAVDPVAALRALCAVHWLGGGGEVTVCAGDEVAEAALGSLGLSDG